MKARYLFVCVIVLLLGVVMISASTGTSPSDPDTKSASPEIKILNRDNLPSPDFSNKSINFLPISDYLVNFHDHEFVHDREAIMVIKFPSCDGTIDRVFDYLDTTSNIHQISILGVKEKAQEIKDDHRKYYDSRHIDFKNHADHLRLKTNISIDYPEFYLFEQGQETDHVTANCNNFEQVIGDLDIFLNN